MSAVEPSRKKAKVYNTLQGAAKQLHNNRATRVNKFVRVIEDNLTITLTL